MRHLTVLLLFLLVLASGCQQAKEETPTSGSVLLLTAESQELLMRKQIADFESLYHEAKVSLVSTTTREAIVQLLNDSVHFICTDRRLNDEERAVAAKAGLQIREHRIAIDALAVITRRDNPTEKITPAQLAGILTGTVKDWSLLSGGAKTGPIHVVMTGRNSGTWELLTQHFLQLSKDPQPPIPAATQAEVVQKVLADPNALGVTGIFAIRDTSLKVKSLAVEAIDSTTMKPDFIKLYQAHVYKNLYPFASSVYLYSTTKPNSVATGFTTFVASAQGQKNILMSGLVPVTMPVRLVQLNQE